MRDSIYRYMKLGVVQAAAYPASVGDAEATLASVRAIAEDAYWTAVELPPIADDACRRAVADVVRGAGLFAFQGSQVTVIRGGLDLGTADLEARRAAVEKLRAEVDLAAEVGAAGIAIASGPEVPDKDREGALDATAEVCREVADAAAGRDLTVVIEQFDADYAVKRLIGPAARCVDLAERVDRPNFGLQVDLSHLPMIGESPAEALGTARPHLRHVHLGSCVLDESHPGHGDSHPGFASPGSANGVPEVAAMLRACFEVGYLAEGRQPIVSLEVKPQAGETPEGVLAAAKRTLNEAWALL